MARQTRTGRDASREPATDTKQLTMPEKNQRIRRVRPSKVADFDDQLWPINCALLIIAGFVTGLVIAMSDFGDSRLLYNGWIRLAGVGAIVGLLFWGVRWLEGRMLRRLQFCILLSLLAHLGLAVYLHDRHLALVAEWERRSPDEVTEQYREITLPDYYWQQVEQPQARQSFEEPLATELPTPTEPEAVERKAQPPEILPRTIPPEEPDVADRQQPDPAATRRMELSAPRRAEAAAGAQISRQPLHDAAVANRPIAEPEVTPEPLRSPVLPDVTPPRPHPESAVAIDPRVESPERTPNDRESPLKAAVSRRRSEAVPESARASDLARLAPTRRAVALTPPADSHVPPVAAAMARMTPDTRPAEAPVRPAEMVAQRSAPQPIVRRPVELADALSTVAEDLAAAATRREPTSRPTPPKEPAPRPASLARVDRGADLPTALAVESRPAVQPAAAGTMLPSRLDALAEAVSRSAAQPPSATSSATAEFAMGTSGPIAQTGQPRSSGAGPSAAVVTGSAPRIARTAGAASPITVAGSAEMARSTPGSVAADLGASALAALNAPETAARRGASVRPLASEPEVGAGPLGSSGTPGPVEAAQQSRVTRYESTPSAVAGGGTPRPGRTAGGTASPAALAESVELPAAASGGGPTDNTIEWPAQVTGPRRDVAGPAGDRVIQPPNGALAAISGQAPPLAVATARRGDAAGSQPGANGRGSTRDSTIQRSREGIDLPTAAMPIESAQPLGAGGVTLAGDGLPSSLPIGPAASELALAADLPLGPIAGAGLDAIASEDPAEGVVVAGWARATNDRGEAANTFGGPPLGRMLEASGPVATLATPEPEPATGSGGGGPSATVEDTVPAADVGPTSRPEGGLPVQIAAIEGPGGLGFLPLPEVGIPSRRARPESEAIHTIMRRFVVERNSGELSIDGRTHESLSEPYQQRAPGRRADVAQAWGGSERTERAVELGLDFFARRQFPDGHWSLHELPPDVDPLDAALGEMESDTAATGLALLSYLGAGYTHFDDKYRGTVGAGIDWLVETQKPTGELFSGGTKYARFYSHGIAAIALCEAHGMTRDRALAEPAQKALDFIVKTQHATRGGWRYELDPQTGRATETDTSVSGWMLMALVSGQMAGLDVPLETFEQLDAWLDSAAAEGADGQYVYNPHAAETPEQRTGRQPNLAMTSEAMLMRMYLGYDRSDPSLVAGAEHLKANLPQLGSTLRPLRDCYFWYYATQAMFQMQGDYWTAWNERFRPLALDSQVPSGLLAGSWNPMLPVEDRWGPAAGRHYVTALHLLMLEVYYRHLPLFQQLGQ